MSKPTKVSVSLRAVLARINRKIKDDDLMIKTARGMTDRVNVGDYYVLNCRLNGVVKRDVDPEDYAREVGALKSWEQVAWPA
jgi:hypothetical protein